MRELVGKRLLDVDVGQIAVRARAFSRATIDIGAGDGRYALHIARTCPDTFAIALDPSVDALRDTARALTRHPLPNAALLVSSVEAASLDALADEATIHFPWGSLLDGVVGERADVLAAIARPLRAGAELRVLVSTTHRDGRVSLTRELLESLSSCYAEAGLELREVRRAVRGDIEHARSSWGKRLDAGRSRPTFVLRCVRLGDRAASLVPSGGQDERARAEDR